MSRSEGGISADVPIADIHLASSTARIGHSALALGTAFPGSHCGHCVRHSPDLSGAIIIALPLYELVRALHVVVLVFQDMAVPHEPADAIGGQGFEADDDPGRLARVCPHGILPAHLVGIRRDAGAREAELRSIASDVQVHVEGLPVETWYSTRCTCIGCV